MKKTLLIALLMMISAMLFAGPFGMEFGWSLEELENSGAYVEYMNTQQNIKAYLVEPPKPHSELPLYLVFIDDEYGIYMIRAISDICYSEYSIRTSYDMLKSQLTSVYGEPEEVDEITWNSDWDGSVNFIRSILYGDRTLIAAWFPPYEEDGAGDIYLGVMANDETAAVVYLEYYSWDYDAVEAKFNSSAASVL